MYRRLILCASLAAATLTVAPVSTAAATGSAPTTAVTARVTPLDSQVAPLSYRPLRPGVRGEAVRRLQRALRERGYRVVVNGKYGPITTAAVRKFQRNQRLAVTGRVGPKTWRALGLHRPIIKPTPSTTTTTTTLPAGGYRHPKPSVERWHGVALDVGWAERDWKRLSCVINVESSGNPAAKNPSSAMGLLQILYRAHKSWVGPDPSILLDGRTNLRLGLKLFRASGWRPWGNICA